MAKQKSGKPRSATIAAADVVRALYAGSAAGKSVKDIAVELGFSSPTVLYVRMSKLRKAGVNLPAFAGGGGNRTDVAGLNAIGASFATV